MLPARSRIPVGVSAASAQTRRPRLATAGLTRAVEIVVHPIIVWTAFSGLFGFWHIPAAYQWALRDEGVHTLEHLCFFVSALAFWTVVIEPSGRRRLGYGPTLLFVATTGKWATSIHVSRPLERGETHYNTP